MLFSRLVTPLALLALTGSLAFADRKTPEQYWAETGLRTSLLPGLNYVAQGNCYQNAQVFRACVNGLNAMAGQAKMQWVPSPLVGDAQFPQLGAVKRTDGPLSLVELRDEPEAAAGESVRMVVQRAKARREKMDAALAEARARSTAADQQAKFAELFRSTAALAVTEPGKDALVAAAALNAISQTFDAHSHLDPTMQIRDQQADADESFSGIGANVQKLQNRVVVAAPIEGGPAEAAGVKPNDVIAAIDGQSMAGQSMDEVVKRLRGPEGTQVQVTLERQGQSVTIPVTRRRIRIENVSAKLVEDFGAKIGHLKIRNFVDASLCDKMRDRIAEFERLGATGLVLDLRGNGGGLVDQAVCMGNRLAGPRVIVKVRDLQRQTFTDLNAGYAQVTNLPMVVLIDAGSASASELLAGALQDYQRAWILGERSFGKGSVQGPTPFSGNRAIMHFQTIQRFYQPLGTTNQMVGITPDIEVPATPNATEDERFFMREADLFSNALAAEGPAWRQSRPEAVARVQGCVQRERLAESRFEELKAKNAVADYQLLTAEATLKCDR